MHSFQIQDTRDFMKKLLLTDTFDAFLLSEATLTTYAVFHIDGRFHIDFLSSSEQEGLTVENCGYTLWKRIRPTFLELTKGKNTPLQFHLVLRQAPHNVERILNQIGNRINLEDVDGLFLNIHFDGEHLTCITGTSLRIFTLDKTIEHTWDSMVDKFFHAKEIPFC